MSKQVSPKMVARTTRATACVHGGACAFFVGLSFAAFAAVPTVNAQQVGDTVTFGGLNPALATQPVLPTNTPLIGAEDLNADAAQTQDGVLDPSAGDVVTGGAPAPAIPPPPTQQSAIIPAQIDQTPVGSIAPLQGSGAIPAQPGPFEPLGIRVGRFILRPAIDVASGYSTNSTNDVTGTSSVFGTVSPELSIESDFSRHAINAALEGTFTRFASGSDAEDIEGTASLTGRYDVDEDTSVSATVDFIIGEDDLTGVADDPVETTVSGTVQVDHRVGQVETLSALSIARNDNDPFIDAAGVTISQEDLNSTLVEGTLRGTLDRGGTLSPFTEVVASRELFDESADEFGNERNVTGIRGLVGLEIDRGEKLSGTIGAGYQQNLVDGDGISDFGAFVAEGALSWSPRRLTTVTLNASTTLDNFPSVATPGDITYDFNLALTQNLRENLDLILGGGLNFQVDGLSEDTDTTVLASVGLDYALNRNLSLQADYNFIRQFTATGLADFTSNAFTVGLRAER